MSYATPQDLIDILGEREAIALSDRAKTGVVDQVELQRILNDAAAEVDGYVGRRYALPLPSVPRLLVTLNVAVARFQATGTDIMSTDDIAKRYKAAVDTLKLIAAGEVSLGNLPLASAGGPAAVGGVSAMRTKESTFGNMGTVL